MCPFGGVGSPIAIAEEELLFARSISHIVESENNMIVLDIILDNIHAFIRVEYSTIETEAIYVAYSRKLSIPIGEKKNRRKAQRTNPICQWNLFKRSTIKYFVGFYFLFLF